MGTKREPEEDIVREFEELRRDPQKWKEFMATQAEKALKHWRGRKTR